MKVLLYLTLFLTGNAFCQNIDLLVYNSPFEKDNFSQLEDKSPLELLLGLKDDMNLDELAQVKSEIEVIASKLEKKNIATESPKNQAKILEQVLHSKWLKEYQLVAPFHLIFEDGRYNCVSATALFAIFCERYNIPYRVQEIPSHVYLIMYPKSAHIEVQTTADKKSSFQYSNSHINRMVSTLVQLGIVTKEEVKARGAKAIFSERYYNTKEIDLTVLVGDQYSNDAIVHIENGDTINAISSAVKATMLHPSEHNNMVKLQVLDSYLHHATMSNDTDFACLLEYSNMNEHFIDNIEYKYGTYLQTNLILKGKKKEVDERHEFLMGGINNEQAENVIQKVYLLACSEYYRQGMNTSKWSEYVIQAYEMDPSAEDIMVPAAAAVTYNVATFNVDDYYDNMSDEEYDELEEELGEAEYRLNLLDGYMEKYPLLKSSTAVSALYLFLYVESCRESFDYEDPEKGWMYYNKVMEKKDTFEDSDLVDEDLLGYMYSSIALYFYHNADYKEALKYVNEGLEIVPDHPRLINKKEIIESKM